MDCYYNPRPFEPNRLRLELLSIRLQFQPCSPCIFLKTIATWAIRQGIGPPLLSDDCRNYEWPLGGKGDRTMITIVQWRMEGSSYVVPLSVPMEGLLFIFHPSSLNEREGLSILCCHYGVSPARLLGELIGSGMATTPALQAGHTQWRVSQRTLRWIWEQRPQMMARRSQRPFWEKTRKFGGHPTLLDSLQS